MPTYGPIEVITNNLVELLFSSLFDHRNSSRKTLLLTSTKQKLGVMFHGAFSSTALNWCSVNFLLSQLEITDHSCTHWPSKSPEPSALLSCRLPAGKGQNPLPSPTALPWGIAISFLDSDSYIQSIVSPYYAKGVVHWGISSSFHHLNRQYGGSIDSTKGGRRKAWSSARSTTWMPICIRVWVPQAPKTSISEGGCPGFPRIWPAVCGAPSLIWIAQFI